MRVRGLIAGLALLLFCNALAGCGGSDRLSPSEYRARLAQIGRQVDKAQAQVEKGLHSKSVAEIRARLNSFSAAEQRSGDEVGRLKPPKDAEAANAELASGEHDTAVAVRTVAAQLARIKSVKAALSLLNNRLGNAKGSREVDGALTRLKKLGYTKSG